MRSGGLPVVIVNPTAPVGDHDVKPTPTGKIVLDFLNGDMPAFIDTGLNVVDVRDTAEGHWQACERGVSGERYILGSENLTLAQILQKLARHHRKKSAHHPASLRWWRIAPARAVRRGQGFRAGRRGYRWTRSAWRKRKCG